jgi:hypothetical protein
MDHPKKRDTEQRQTKHGTSVDTRNRTKASKTLTILCLCSGSRVYGWSMFCLPLFCVSCLRMVHVFFVFVLCLVSTDGSCFVCFCSVSRFSGWSMFCLSLFCFSCLRMVHVLFVYVLWRHRTKTKKTWTIRRHETQNKGKQNMDHP